MLQATTSSTSPLRTETRSAAVHIHRRRRAVAHRQPARDQNCPLHALRASRCISPAMAIIWRTWATACRRAFGKASAGCFRPPRLWDWLPSQLPSPGEPSRRPSACSAIWAMTDLPRKTSRSPTESANTSGFRTVVIASQFEPKPEVSMRPIVASLTLTIVGKRGLVPATSAAHEDLLLCRRRRRAHRQSQGRAQRRPADRRRIDLTTRPLRRESGIPNLGGPGRRSREGSRTVLRD